MHGSWNANSILMRPSAIHSFLYQMIKCKQQHLLAFRVPVYLKDNQSHRKCTTWKMEKERLGNNVTEQRALSLPPHLTLKRNKENRKL